MSRDEVLRLYDAGDLYGMLLAVGRAWLAKDHPEVQHAAVCGHIGRGIPELIVPLIPSPLRRDLEAASPRALHRA